MLIDHYICILIISNHKYWLRFLNCMPILIKRSATVKEWTTLRDICSSRLNTHKIVTDCLSTSCKKGSSNCSPTNFKYWRLRCTNFRDSLPFTTLKFLNISRDNLFCLSVISFRGLSLCLLLHTSTQCNRIWLIFYGKGSLFGAGGNSLSSFFGCSVFTRYWFVIKVGINNLDDIR